MTTFFATPPRLEHGWDIFFEPGDGQRTGTHLDDDRTGIGGKDGFNQLLLLSGQAEGLAIAGLMFDGPVGTDADDGGVAAAAQLGS